MEKRLLLVTLAAAEPGRARAFYEAVGGASNTPPEQGAAFFPSGGMVVALWDRSSLASDSAVADGGGWGGVTFAHNVRSEAEVDAVIEEARAAGATIGREPGETLRGGYSANFIDPRAHPREVAHNPRWSIEPDVSTRPA